ncbi:DUF4105 domain-containing protein [Lentisphaera marina]|uniref:Lnb N-terminal periplasmic domain-containing protein n=1 Tax=Lentisphaera marina TaxID=1111041 RepID=UPI002365DEC9|nr:DUF4105 domain-containing protein [Lentisphaera marina]MDD7987421.1 DUF4105 domain-containing protein [Lentisphaera marina]
MKYLLCFLLLLSVGAMDVAGLKELAKERGVASERHWLNLLHYDKGFFSEASVVDDDKFFLSPQGKYNPEAELEACLEAFSRGDPSENEHVVNLFPARLDWLLEVIPEAKEVFVSDHSPKFERILKNIEPNKVQLIFPSQYMNNPSSLFGHTLLNIEGKRNKKLMAYSVNYSARTEETDGVQFAIKGVLGMYPGTFNIVRYFEKVIEYSDHNMRDVWEYDFKFTQKEVERVLMHVIEMEEVNSDYYFFDENCSYNLLFAIDAARPGLNLARQANDFWVLPVDTIKLVKGNGLLKEGQYRPSKSTKIRSVAQPLKPSQKNLSKKLSRREAQPEEVELLSTYTMEEQRRIYDVAVELMLIHLADGEMDQDEYQELYLGTLRTRSKLGRNDKPYEYAVPFDPAEGHDSMRVKTSVGSYDDEAFVGLSLRPAYHALEDAWAGYLKGSAIEVLNTELYYFYDDKDLELRKFQLATIHSLAPVDEYFNPMSWVVDVGAEALRLREDDEDLHVATYIDTGFGQSSLFKDSILVYGLLRPSLHFSGVLNDSYMLSIGPELGTMYYFNQHSSAQLSGRHSWGVLGQSNQMTELKSSLNWSVSKSLSLTGFFKWTDSFHQDWNEFGLSLNYYF